MSRTQFDGRGYSNDKFGYLPPGLDNDFIREGHNRYEEQKAAVKTAKQSLASARSAGRMAAAASKKEAFSKAHPVRAAKAGTYSSKDERKSAVAAAKVERKTSPESAFNKKRSARAANLTKRSENLAARAKKLGGE